MLQSLSSVTSRIFPTQLDRNSAQILQKVRIRLLLSHLFAPRPAQLLDCAGRPAELRGQDGGVELLPQSTLVRDRVHATPETTARVQGGDSIALKKGTEKRSEKGPESKFATSICMNSEKEPSLYRFGPFFTKEISILIQ